MSILLCFAELSALHGLYGRRIELWGYCPKDGCYLVHAFGQACAVASVLVIGLGVQVVGTIT